MSVKEAAQLYIDEIERRTNAGDEVRVSDIVLLYTLQQADPEDVDVAEKIQVYEAISKAVANQDEMSMEETAQIGEVMKQVSEDISTNQNLSENSELANQVLSAVDNMI